MHKGGHAKLILLHVLALSSVAFLAAAMRFHRRKRRRQPTTTTRDNKVVPRLATTESGHIHRLERFSHYVARQMGFEDANECPQLCKLAYDYIRKNKGSEDDIYAFLSNDPDAGSLYVNLIEEFDKCLLGYFAFHWGHATEMIGQVLSVDSEPTRKLKTMVMAATRKQRFERITKNLKVARVFSTLLVAMKAIGIASNNDSHCTEVMVPAALSERSPVLLLMGGGMGAGKSTVLKDILNESFWVEARGNAVVVEADAFKETDVIYKALNSRGHHDMLQTAELVHQSSTDAASSLLVTALNEGRDVIMDGTLSWEPFVEQTIAMARNVHHRRYRMGVGYKVTDDGSMIENYWEQVEEEQEEGLNNKRRPYRIELVGVVCDAYLAVVRGIRRAILMGRAVRVKSQLRSHKRFASAFPHYCQLVDNARLYCTNGMGTPPELIAWKDGDNKMLVDPQEIDCLSKVSKLNDNADSIYELYPEVDPACASSAIWNEVVMDPSRADLQHELKIAIQKIGSVTS